MNGAAWLADPAMALRFWPRVDRSGGPSACWPWTAAVNEKGYGRVRYERSRWTRAHRVAFALAIAPIPADRVVMHACDNPPCCNPAHLRLGSVADNVRDMVAKGRQPAHMRPLAACRRGHPLASDNLRVANAGKRRCRTCYRAYEIIRRLGEPLTPDLARLGADSRDESQRLPEAPLVASEPAGIGLTPGAGPDSPLRAGDLPTAAT